MPGPKNNLRPPGRGKRNLEDPGLFADALAKIGKGDQEPYLGDYEVIQALLRGLVRDCLPLLRDSGVKAVKPVVKEVAGTLLGQEEHYGTVPRWNEPGGIDVFLAKWCGVTARTPRGRVEGALLTLLAEVVKVANIAGGGVPQSEWDWQVSNLLRQYALLCLGIDLPTQALL